MAVPGVVEFTMIVHWPLAFVGPLPHVPPTMLAPTSPLIVELMLTPGAATKPLPAFFCTVTVNVCGAPTLLTPDACMLIRASTHVFWFATLKAP